MKEFTSSENSVQSSMIYGSQYDAMMNWMVKSGNEVGKADSSKSNKTQNTGEDENDFINNVYDLYGCHKEWTQEGEENIGRGLHGGYYSSSSDNYYNPSQRWNGLSAGESNYNAKRSQYSSRLALYIK